MKDVSTIGLDLAKNVFQVHGVDGSGKTVLRRQLEARAGFALFQEAIAASGGYRGLCHVALLGTRNYGVGS